MTVSHDAEPSGHGGVYHGSGDVRRDFILKSRMKYEFCGVEIIVRTLVRF